MPRFIRKKRTMRRRKVYRRKRGTSNLVTKAFLAKKLARTIESKRVSLTSSFTSTSETAAQVQMVGQYIVPGVTDQGRIGNTIHLTGVQIRYHYAYELGEFFTETEKAPPITLHMYLVQAKNNFVLPQVQWFKSIDAGDANPYQELNADTINEGTYILNTDHFKVLGHHSRRLQPDCCKRLVSTRGIAKFPMKNVKMVFQSNSTDLNGIAEITPQIYLVTYFYTGITPTGLSINLDFGVRKMMSIYYKD